MTVVEEWTGGHARALQAAMRLTNEAFAEHLGISPRTVGKWRRRPDMVPSPQLQEALDTSLRRSDPETQSRFLANLGLNQGSADEEPVLDQLHRVVGELTRILAGLRPTGVPLPSPDRPEEVPR
jgi:transcriptional regulator with XRE-family HTH domain